MLHQARRWLPVQLRTWNCRRAGLERCDTYLPDSGRETPAFSNRNCYNLGMVALSQQIKLSGKDPQRFFPRHHTHRLRARRCSKSGRQSGLRRRKYDECDQLESCSRDPIGYVDGENLYQRYFPTITTDPTGRLVCDLDPSSHDCRPGQIDPTPGAEGPNKKRPFGVGYWVCALCTPKEDRLRPVPGVKNPPNYPIVGTGPSGGSNEFHPFPTTPPGAVGTGGCSGCVALIVKCPGLVAVFHFTGGDSPFDTLNQYNWPSSCDAMICGGDAKSPQSNCLGEDVEDSASTLGLNVVGVSGNSACGVDANGDWWQHGN